MQRGWCSTTWCRTSGCLCAGCGARPCSLTLTIVATVGLGIGATTAIFAPIDATLLRPLPYADPGRLVRIYTDAPPNRFRFSVADYLALQAQQTRFEQIAGYTSRAHVLQRRHRRGAAARHGRDLDLLLAARRSPGDRPRLHGIGRPARQPAAPSSSAMAFWQQRLGGRPDAIGKPIRLDGVRLHARGRLAAEGRTARTGPGLLRRRAVGAAAAQGAVLHHRARAAAQPDADRAAAAERAARDQPADLSASGKRSYQDEKATWAMMDLKAHVVGDVRTIAGLALAAVALVWLIACANASNLLVARVTSRRRELAVRAALGASRGRVMRYLLAESALLALGAAAVGDRAGRRWASACCATSAPTYFPRTQEIGARRTGAAGCCAASRRPARCSSASSRPLHGTGGPVDESLRSIGPLVDRQPRRPAAARAARRQRSSRSRRRCWSSPGCCSSA